MRPKQPLAALFRLATSQRLPSVAAAKRTHANRQKASLIMATGGRA